MAEVNKEAAQQCLERAVASFKAGDTSSALKLVEKSLRLYPSANATAIKERILATTSAGSGSPAASSEDGDATPASRASASTSGYAGGADSSHRSSGTAAGSSSGYGNRTDGHSADGDGLRRRHPAHANCSSGSESGGGRSGAGASAQPSKSAGPASSSSGGGRGSAAAGGAGRASGGAGASAQPAPGSAAAAAAARASATPEQRAAADRITKTKDYYDILNVPRDADSDAIRKAFLKISRQVHPDKNPAGEEAFKRLNAAHDTLIDPDKRAHYDRYGDAPPEGGGGGGGAAGGHPFHGHPFAAGGGVDINEEFLRAFFGGGAGFGGGFGGGFPGAAFNMHGTRVRFGGRGFGGGGGGGRRQAGQQQQQEGGDGEEEGGRVSAFLQLLPLLLLMLLTFTSFGGSSSEERYFTLDAEAPFTQFRSTSYVTPNLPFYVKPELHARMARDPSLVARVERVVEKESFRVFDTKCAEELTTRHVLQQRVRTTADGRRRQRMEAELAAFPMPYCTKLSRHFRRQLEYRLGPNVDPAAYGIDTEFRTPEQQAADKKAAQAPVEEW